MFEDRKARRRAARDAKALARATRYLDDHLLVDAGLGHMRRDRRRMYPLGLVGTW